MFIVTYYVVNKFYLTSGILHLLTHFIHLAVAKYLSFPPLKMTV